MDGVLGTHNPHARFRVALLLACDPGRTDEAVPLLIGVACTGHPLALDLLDAYHDVPAPGDTCPNAASPLSQVAAQCAWDLACTARDHGANTHACAFFRGAARAGMREAVFELAKMVLAETDPLTRRMARATGN